MPELETEKMKKLKAERAAIDARIRQEQEKLAKEQRAIDTRRKVLAGACVLEWGKRDSALSDKLMVELGSFLTRETDRALFELAPLPGKGKREA